MTFLTITWVQFVLGPTLLILLFSYVMRNMTMKFYNKYSTDYKPLYIPHKLVLIPVAVVFLTLALSFTPKFDHVSPSDCGVSMYDNSSGEMRELEKSDSYDGQEQLNMQREKLPSSLEKINEKSIYITQ